MTDDEAVEAVAKVIYAQSFSQSWKVGECDRIAKAAIDALRKMGWVPLAAVRQVVDEQAEDEGLWFISENITEAYLQQALRELHAAIEDSQQEVRLNSPEVVAEARAAAQAIIDARKDSQQGSNE